jgi:Helix-turn-helix domain
MLYMELKSKREAAELLGVSTRGIERAVRRGHLTPLYRDSKHGKKAWFRTPELARYKRLQQEREPIGFIPGIPRQTAADPTVGSLIPIVDMEPRGRKGRQAGDKVVSIAEQLVLNLNEVVQLSGLPRNFIAQNIHSSKLKAVRIGRSHYVKRSDLERFVREL